MLALEIKTIHVFAFTTVSLFLSISMKIWTLTWRLFSNSQMPLLSWAGRLA